ncbi:MAG: hypothetical protein QNI87_10350 [Erythrobacter sp.]|uniref:hypothetical protein n=1 Tax=Erythrobacter sp. TaxID=1042 RepID=UPI002633C8E5|nr:hypothetical protein [Erythrobacter sp.]MDJ0978925.1 hypothetical protein [Erythrobacter sp.]
MPDLTIRRRSLPPVPREERNAGFFRVRDGVVDLDIEGIVRIRVASEELIEVDVLDAKREREARLYLTGSGFGAWTYLCGRFPFHCGLVTRNGLGFALTGPSGAGKSTLTAALVERGFGFMSDDVVVFDPGGASERIRSVSVTPSFPRMKLWQDAADHLAIRTSPLARLHQDMDKFHVPFEPDRVVHEATLAGVFRLRFDDEREGVDCRPLASPEALRELRSNLYRQELVPALGLEEAAFRMILNVLQTVPVFDLSRPRDFSCFDATLDAVVAQVAAHEGSTSATTSEA